MKRKLMAILMAGMMLAALLSVTAYAAAPLRIGDLNLDGQLNILDFVRQKKIAAQMITPDAYEKLEADMNGDNTVDSGDFVLMRKSLLDGIVYGDNEISCAELVQG